MNATSPNPWLAIDAATPPMLRARKLREEWEHFLEEGHANAVRGPVAESWRRSLDAGVDPSGSRLAPVAADRRDALTLWDEHPLRQAGALIRERLGSIAGESEHLIVVSDRSGLLLQLDGPADVRSRAADSMNFTEGALWSEAGAGTNAIGTALAADHAVQIFATEHFIEVVQAWTCSAAPVHDPETGALLGVIDLTGLQKHVHPHSLAAAITTARAVEGFLRSRMDERDQKLRDQHGWRIAPSRDQSALVSASGRVIMGNSDGWSRGARIELPPGGGDFALPSGRPAFAEPIGGGRAFVVRHADAPRAPRRPAADALTLLADEHASLRRLATAAAQGTTPAQIFAAVAEEIAPLLGADAAAVARYEGNDRLTFLAGVGAWVGEVGTGVAYPLEEGMALTAVLRTGRSARMDSPRYPAAPGPLVGYLHRFAPRSTVASPIVVEGRIWGAVLVSTQHRPLAADTENRMTNFTELVGTVIANAEGRAELAASRARVIAAGDEARRRLQRDLHDGAQARMVTTVITLKLMRQELEGASGRALELLDEALAQAETASRELRELAHGILPPALSNGGLRGGIDALVSRFHMPVSVDVTGERLPESVEANAYFIVAEALTNAVRHAHATQARIAAAVDGDVLRLEVRDDGVGGAYCAGGSGLVGLGDRAAAANGHLYIQSPPGQGTVISATLPIHTAMAA